MTQPLSPAELRELEEYDRIVKFAEDVMAGRHPRVKIPPHILNFTKPVNSSIATTTANHSTFASPTGPRSRSSPVLRIDYKQDYYKALGVQSHVSSDSIHRGYQSKYELYAPKSAAGKIKWISKNPHVRRQVRENWKRVENAYRILTNPALRKMYDAGKPVDPPSPQVSHGHGKGHGYFQP